MSAEKNFNGEPEFVTISDLPARFGIGRSLAYSLIEDGLIRSVSLRREGMKRGKRLVNVASVREFLRSQPEDVHPGWSAQMHKAGLESARTKRERR
jgi:hypothetical protein